MVCSFSHGGCAVSFVTGPASLTSGERQNVSDCGKRKRRACKGGGEEAVRDRRGQCCGNQERKGWLSRDVGAVEESARGSNPGQVFVREAGAAPCVVGCLAASPASPALDASSQFPPPPCPSCVNQRCPLILPNVPWEERVSS